MDLALQLNKLSHKYIFTINFYKVYIMYPLGEGHRLCFQQTWVPSSLECFVPSFVETIEKSKIWNVYKQTDNKYQKSLMDF